MAKTHAQTLSEINTVLDKIMELRRRVVQLPREDIDWGIISADLDACAQLGSEIVTFLLQNDLRLGPNVVRHDKPEVVKPAQKATAPKQTLPQPKKPADVLKRAHTKPVMKKAPTKTPTKAPVKAAPRKR